MKHLPLHYFQLIVGHAQVDDSVFHSLSHLRWGLRIPRSIRREFCHRPDVFVSALRDDPTLLPLCSPWLQLPGLSPIYLCRIVLHPHILRLLCELSYSPERKEQIYDHLNLLVPILPRVTFVNRSRVDCQHSNLREIRHLDDKTHSSSLTESIE